VSELESESDSIVISMNNTAYVPPGGPLSVFTAAVSQGGGSVTPLQEALISRMRPFGFTASDLKDLPPSPFLPGGLGGLVRPDGFPNFQMQSPFLHPALESRLPALTASGAFRPMFSMSGETPILKSFPSAFQPPSSRGDKSSPSSLFSPGHNLFPRMSPTSSRSSPSPIPPHIKTDENSNTDPRLQLSSPEDGSRVGEEEDERSPKRVRLAGLYGCPICGIGLTGGELETHFNQELDYLTKISLSMMRSPELARQRYPRSPGPGMDQAPRTRWDSFQRIQRNRQSRIRVKLCRKAGKRQDEILEEDASNEDDIDIVGEEKEEEINEEKNESDKKTQKQGLYGPDQFTEADVLAIANELEKEDPVSVNVCDDDTGDVKETKIKQENDGCQKKWCSQCQGSMAEAVVSLACWHVQCKNCWLTQLATKKVCGECRRPAKPQDLRKVFL